MKDLLLKTYVATLCENNKGEYAIFTSDKKYSIPGYQRPYEWNDEKIENMMLTLFDFYQEGKEKYDNDTLLFGTIQLNINQSQEYEIIDGQQRLVSFYLLINALTEMSLSIAKPDFNVKNYIQDDYNRCLAEATDSNNTSIYGINYRQIKKILSDSSAEIDLVAFFNMVVSRVKFVVIITENITTIERTLQIFTSLNTTGLPLDVKDVFKVRFCDFLSGDTECNLKKINEAYSLLEDLNYLSEDDLLDVYRFFLLGKTKQGTSNNLKGSNQKFFNDIFDSDVYSEIQKNMKAEDIVCIAKVIEKTESILQEKRCDETTSENICFLSRDLMSWSGYGRLKNLLYYFVLCQSPFAFNITEETVANVTEETVANACCMLLDLSSMCTLYRMYYSKIVNEVLSFVVKSVINYNITKPSDLQKKISEFLNDKEFLFNNYNSLISGESSLFDNSRIHYFLLLSYAEDCIKEKERLEKCYTDVLHRTKWDIDIEHIHSQKFFNNSKISNELGGSLGNLMYLESGINRTLGKDIKGSKVKNSEEDYHNKKTKEAGYKKSELVSVKAFLKNYDEEKNWTEELIKGRLSEKKELINKLFKRIFSEKRIKELI